MSGNLDYIVLSTSWTSQQDNIPGF